MHLSVAVVPAPDQVVVRLTGDAARPTLPRLAAGLTRAAEHGTASVVVDVAGTRFPDGAALRALVSFSDTLFAAGRRCRLVGAPAATRRLVAESGLAGVLELDGPLTGADPVRPRPRPRPDGGARPDGGVRPDGEQPVAVAWRPPPARGEIHPARPAAQPLQDPDDAPYPRVPVALDRWR